MAADCAIEAEGLVKSYGSVRALDGVDLSAPVGTVLGLLGPNGAGKTTAVRILTTLLPADGGTARVAGVDVAREAPLDATVEQPRPNFDPPSEETPQGSSEASTEEEDDRGYDPDTGHEDVLEDTPRFLEDAPEDDDLWFEQKPPKDFDLD